MPQEPGPDTDIPAEVRNAAAVIYHWFKEDVGKYSRSHVEIAKRVRVRPELLEPALTALRQYHFLSLRHDVLYTLGNPNDWELRRLGLDPVNEKSHR